MRRFAVLLWLLALVASATGAQAQSAYEPTRLMAQVALIPLADNSASEDIDDLLRRFWRDYYQASGPNGFTAAQVRVGRYDLDDDGHDELFLMIDQPGWQSGDGKPFVIATWSNRHWTPIGWGWGDEDGVFVTTETVNNWHTVDAGKFYMRWSSDGYRRDPKKN